jgi:hypothetical protein
MMNLFGDNYLINQHRAFARIDPSFDNKQVNNSGETGKTSVDCIETVQELELLSEKWQRLSQLAGSPLCDHEWFSSCAQTFCPPYRLKIFTLKDGDQFKAAVPLAERGGLFKRIEFLGSSILLEPTNAIFENVEALSHLLNSIASLEVPFFLKGITSTSEEAMFWEKQIGTRKWLTLIREERIPWIDTRGEWKDFERQISSSRRSAFRRMEHKASYKGKVEFDVVVPDEDDVNTYLDDVFSIESSNWKKRVGSTLSFDKALGKFFRKYSLTIAKKGQLRLFFLRINGVPIATQLTVAHSNRLWLLKIGYDETWSWCSPGILLMDKVVRYCFDQHLDSCEMLGADEPWLHIWTKEFHNVTTYRLYPKSVRGAIHKMVDILRLGLHKIKYDATRALDRKRNLAHV